MSGTVKDVRPRAAELAAQKGGATISVCLPARDEAATVGAIVEIVRDQLVEGTSLVDEIVVVDDGSVDATARVAADAGARVVTADGDGGKGGALQTAVAATTGSVIVFCDADVRDFDPGFVVGLAGPLLADPAAMFVKAFYARPLDGAPRGGGRVTELMARPLLTVLFPELTHIVQPLSGEFAAHRAVLERLPFVEGYGVDLGLLIDVAARYGVASIVQVDLGRRVHRNRPLAELAPMATVILQTALRRAGVDGLPDVELRSPDRGAIAVRYRERPPLVG